MLHLTSAQAKAIYDAMCALNNISGKLDMHVGKLHVYESMRGSVVVKPAGGAMEVHETQHAFADAYGWLE